MAPDQPRKIPIVFYRTPGGNEVVRDWLRGLDEADRHVIGQDLMRIQYRWPIGMPLCRPLGDGLWEVRSDLAGKPHCARAVQRPGRHDSDPAWIHQETRKIADEDLALARKRRREFDPQE